MKPSELINKLGGDTRVAKLIGSTQSHVSQMKKRESIPLKYWPKFCAVSPGLTYEILAKIHLKEDLAA